MKPANTVLVCLLVAVASAMVTSLLLGPGRDNTRTAEEVIELSSRLHDLATKQAALEESLIVLLPHMTSAAETIGSSALEAEITESNIERIVARVLEEREGSQVEADSALEELDVGILLDDLLSPQLNKAEKASIWKQLRETGQMDAMVAEFERRAEAAPSDSMTQTELGWAYFQKMASTVGGPEAGKWGSEGSQALIRALELDESNWDARFSLAQHYFYAEMRGDAVRHLEVLVEQQSRRAPSDKHALAYLFLGNLYMDRGNDTKAKKVWTDGLQLFSTNQALQQRLKQFE